MVTPHLAQFCRTVLRFSKKSERLYGQLRRVADRVGETHFDHFAGCVGCSPAQSRIDDRKPCTVGASSRTARKAFSIVILLNCGYHPQPPEMSGLFAALNCRFALSASGFQGA